MRLSYAGVTLQICKFNQVVHRAVFTTDGTTPLGMHIYLDVQCVFNPWATATKDGIAENRDAGFSGDTMPVSIQAVRQVMMQPQQHLVVDVGGTIIIESPPQISLNGRLQVAPSDARNGPTPIDFSVIELIGTKTAIVRYRIECFSTEPARVPGRVAKESVLLANRWTAAEEIMEDYSSVISVQGEAVFNGGFLRQYENAFFDATFIVDSFRKSIIHPLMNGYIRKALRVSPSSDGTKLIYSFRDEQQYFQLKPDFGIVRVQGMRYGDLDWSGGLFGNPWLKMPELYVGLSAEVWGRFGVSSDLLATALIHMAGVGFHVNTGKRIGLHTRIQVDFPTRHGSISIMATSNGLFGGAINVFKAPNLNALATGWNENNTDLYQVGGDRIANIAPGGSQNAAYSDAFISLLTQALDAPINNGPPFAAPASAATGLTKTWLP